MKEADLDLTEKERRQLRLIKNRQPDKGLPKFMRKDFDLAIAESKRIRREERRVSMMVKRQLKTMILSDRQKIAIGFLSDFLNDWPEQYIAAQAMVSTQLLRKWRNDPFFLKALDLEIGKRRTVLRREAYQQLFKGIKKGDRKLLAMYFKMTGDLKDKVEITQELPDEMPEEALDQEIGRLADELGINPESLN